MNETEARAKLAEALKPPGDTSEAAAVVRHWNVVTPEDLDQWTSRGFEVVETIQLARRLECVPTEGSPQGNVMYGEQRYYIDPKHGGATYSPVAFLIRGPAQSVAELLGGLRSKVADLEAKLGSKTVALRDLERSFEKKEQAQEQAVNAAMAQIERERRDTRAQIERLESDLKGKANLESDLQRVRTAIGEREWKSILGDDSCPNG